MRVNSAWHNINADRMTYYSRWKKAIYVIANHINNALPHQFVDLNLQTRHWKIAEVREKIDILADPKSSPSRTLSNLFWLSLRWDKIQKELLEIHIFDSGCGSGNYGLRMKDWSNERVASYFGVDKFEHENWSSLSQLHPEIQCYQINSDNISEIIPNSTTLFTSQSAIEHFDEDITYFRQIRDWIEIKKLPTLQFHLFPSAVGLALFGLHGIRQYTPRTISYITRLFSAEKHSCILFKLGGTQCNLLHLQTIKGKPTDLRETNTDEYVTRVKEAIVHDLSHPNDDPSFYALAICSYMDSQLLNKLFD